MTECNQDKIQETQCGNFSGEAKIFKAFCDENRLQILSLLKDGEKCACKILEEMHISQSTLSHHMKILCESGIVSCRKEGKWTYYAISLEGIKGALQILVKISEFEEYSKGVCSWKR